MYRKNLEPWQNRLINEYLDLEFKITKLINFLDNDNLDEHDLLLMTDQCNYMQNYANTLAARLKKLSLDPDTLKTLYISDDERNTLDNIDVFMFREDK